MPEFFQDEFTDVRLLQEIRRTLNTTRSAFGDFVAENLRIQSGWSFPYNLDPVFVVPEVQNGGTVTHSTGSFAVLNTGTDPAGYAEIRTRRALAYTPGVGAVCVFTAVFDNPQPNTRQFIGIGNHADGWFFGYMGMEFGILRKNNNEEFWIPQNSWNIDKRDEDCRKIIPQHGNVYRIDFQWLGFGAQYFSMENHEGVVSQVHRIDYTNKNTDVSVQNPSLPITALVQNDGNTTDIELRTPSAMAGSYGEIDSSAFEVPIGFDRISQSIPSNTETHLFTIRNPEDFLGKTNRLYSLPILAGFASDGNKAVVLRFYFNSVITGGTWVDLAPGVVPLQYNINPTSYTPGLKVLSLPLGKVDRDKIDLSPFRGLISPTGYLTVTAISVNSTEITSVITFKSRV